jgi:hypothetical protein
MLSCEICILLHFSCFVVAVVLSLFLAPTCLVDSCRFHGSVDVECVGVVVKMVIRWLVELHLDEVPSVF